MAHCHKEVLTPPRHTRLPRADDCLAPQKETRFQLLDHKVFHRATFDDLAYCGCFHKAKVSDDSKKAVSKIFDLNAGIFGNIWDAVGEDCEHNVALMEHPVVLEIVQERDWCA